MKTKIHKFVWSLAILVAVFLCLPIACNALDAKAAADFILRGQINGMPDAIRFGDETLVILQERTRNFEDMENGATLIADFLARVKTPNSKKVASDLYARNNRTHRLVGAVGLAAQGCLPDTELLMEVARQGPVHNDTTLAIKGLALSHSKTAVPLLLDVLKQSKGNYSRQSEVCDALGQIGDAHAVPYLEQCLADQDFYALPAAFEALVLLGDKRAVPLAIDRITPRFRLKSPGFIVQDLRDLTGQKLGFRRRDWSRWWKRVGKEWEIPSQPYFSHYLDPELLRK